MSSIRILYQPIVRLADLRADYVEVLTRTAEPDGTLSGPEPIVEAMTGTERSMRLTAGIMQRALAEYEAFGFAEGDLGLAFNLPLDAMLHPDLVEKIESIRAESRLPSHNIRFELTERHEVHDLEAAHSVIVALREAGYGLALDDITPGMHNLPALINMPIRAVKLDRSVVISEASEDHEFIRQMLKRAASNQIDVIAEGIETIEMCDDMRRRGVTHGQGYLFSHPLPAAELQVFLRDEAKIRRLVS